MVVDPTTRHITHIVVEPHHRHHQARLVPIELIDLSGAVAEIRLDTQHLRALQSVADSDFVRLGDEIDLGDDWDVGIEHVLAMPYAGGPAGVGGWDAGYSPTNAATIEFDRIPKGDCEIRRESRVVSADGHDLGLVDGFLADESHIEGAIVQTGLPGFRHLVVIPIASVARVSNDRVTIGLDRDTFHRLPPVSGLDGVHAATTRFERLEHSMATAGKGLRARVAARLHRRADGHGDRPS